MRETQKLLPDVLEEETKNAGAISSKSNSIATGAANSKKGESIKSAAAAKKKKSKADRESSQLAKSTKSKKINLMHINSNSMAQSDISGSKGPHGENSAANSDAPQRNIKSTSSTSARNTAKQALRKGSANVTDSPTKKAKLKGLADPQLKGEATSDLITMKTT